MLNTRNYQTSTRKSWMPNGKSEITIGTSRTSLLKTLIPTRKSLISIGIPLIPHENLWFAQENVKLTWEIKDAKTKPKISIRTVCRLFWIFCRGLIRLDEPLKFPYYFKHWVRTVPKHWLRIVPSGCGLFRVVAGCLFPQAALVRMVGRAHWPPWAPKGFPANFGRASVFQAILTRKLYEALHMPTLLTARAAALRDNGAIETPKSADLSVCEKASISFRFRSRFRRSDFVSPSLRFQVVS